jgi:AraC family transcriptional regulator
MGAARLRRELRPQVKFRKWSLMSVVSRAANAVSPSLERGESLRAVRSPCQQQIAVDARNRLFNDDRGRRPQNRTKVGAINALVRISPSEIVQRPVLTFDGMAAEAVHITKHCTVETYFRGFVHLLALFEYGTRSEGSTFVEGTPRSALKDYRRKFIFVPSGYEYRDRQEPDSLARAAYFYFDTRALPFEADSERAATSFTPRLFFEDEGLWQQAIKLKALLDDPQARDRHYGEALCVVLAHELVRLNSGSRNVETTKRGGLAGWQQRIVTDYIEEHLAECIPISTLAQLVRLSLFHFCRSFKQSLGMPPHRFVTRRRIERAKSLLAKRVNSVSEVGAAIGFSETSSFTAAFRKATGLTPSNYQRSLM